MGGAHPSLVVEPRTPDRGARAGRPDRPARTLPDVAVDGPGARLDTREEEGEGLVGPAEGVHSQGGGRGGSAIVATGSAQVTLESTGLGRESGRSHPPTLRKVTQSFLGLP